MYPLFLNLRDRVCTVVGGGPVGRRKAAALLESGARVRLVCLEDRPVEEISDYLAWLKEPYRPDHLNEAVLAFAAATPEVNRRVVEDAKARKILVNSASDPDSGDFFVAATVRRGDLVMAVSTLGAAPALTREIRRRLEVEFDEDFARWVDLLAEMRPIVLSSNADAEQRRGILEGLSNWTWLERVRQEGTDAVRRAMLAEVQSLSGGSAHSL